MLFTPTAGVPDFSAMIRSCSSMTARSGIAIEAPKDVARHSAIGAQRAVFVNHVEKREFNARCRLACHVGFPVLVQRCHASSAASPSSSHGRQDQIARHIAWMGKSLARTGKTRTLAYIKSRNSKPTRRIRREPMAFKPNYRRDRAERQRAARARTEEKQRKKEEKAALRKAGREAAEAPPDEKTTGQS